MFLILYYKYLKIIKTLLSLFPKCFLCTKCSRKHFVPATSVGMFTVTKDLQSLKVADAMDLTLFGNFTVACHRNETIFVDPLKSKKTLVQRLHTVLPNVGWVWCGISNCSKKDVVIQVWWKWKVNFNSASRSSWRVCMCVRVYVCPDTSKPTNQKQKKHTLKHSTSTEIPRNCNP